MIRIPFSPQGDTVLLAQLHLSVSRFAQVVISPVFASRLLRLMRLRRQVAGLLSHIPEAASVGALQLLTFASNACVFVDDPRGDFEETISAVTGFSAVWGRWYVVPAAVPVGGRSATRGQSLVVADRQVYWEARDEYDEIWETPVLAETAIELIAQRRPLPQEGLAT